MTTEQIEILNRINNQMARGDIKKISIKTRLSREYVGKVLNPDSDAFNEKVVDTAIKIIEDRNSKNKRRLSQLAAIF